MSYHIVKPPSIWKALLIGNSIYDNPKIGANLLQVKNDIEAVYKICIELLNLKESDIKVLNDKTTEEIEAEYEEFIELPARKADREKKFGQYFIYYSGHGRIEGAYNMGIDKNDNDINLDKMVIDIACRKNQTVIAFFDCCRLIQ